MAPLPHHKPVKLHLVGNPLRRRTNDGRPNALSSLHRQVQNAFGHDPPAYKQNDEENPQSSRPMKKLPEFHKHKETTNIELFYDLFFVANLTTFSNVHAINTPAELTSYIGFFCLLWFTWCQVSLFDVRFVADSILERVAKAAHLGVMVGFSIVGPNYKPSVDGSGGEVGVFRTMSWILMMSRLVLALQYLLVMWHVRKYPRTKVPFALISGVNFIAAFIYLGVAFSFHDSDTRSYGNRSFYVVAVFEILANILISSFWKVVTFKGTHLVQRMSLLTLIILGEGAIVVCQSVAQMVQVNSAWSTPTIGTILAAVSVIYFLFMLYFDDLPDYHFGSIRQQIWAGCHFPFHISVVLTMEGMAQFLLWHQINAIAKVFLGQYNSQLSGDDVNMSSNFTALSNNLNTTIWDTLKYYPPQSSDTNTTMIAELQTISYGYTFDNQTEFQALINDLSATVVQSLFQSYGFRAPDSYNSSDTTTVSATEQLQADAVVISLVFLYFFISAGSMLFFMGLLNFLTLPRAEFKHHIASHKELALRFSAYIVAGIILCLLATMVHSTSGHNLEESAWLLPLLTIMIVAVLLAQYVHFSGEELEDPSDSEGERDEVEDDREGDEKGPSQPSAKPKLDMKEEAPSYVAS